MSQDFRAPLYDAYVSRFKGAPDLRSEGSFEWWDHKYLPLLDGLDHAAPILEIGCGSGGLLSYLERRGFSHARGIDLSQEQIELATRRGVAAERADALSYLEYHPNAFDVILAVDVLEHLDKQELAELAPLLYAALRPAGRLLIQTANGAGLFPRQVIYGDLTHLTILSPESLAQLLKSAGFQHLRFYETGPIPIRLRGRFDLLIWRAIKRVANTVRKVETGKSQRIWTENFICLAFKPT